MSAAEALQRLKDGNDRFAAGQSQYGHLVAERLATCAEEGQAPYATVVGCSDSRAAVELLFDVGMGDLFVIRVAGNVVETNEAGSIEYGVEHIQTPLLVVLGHTQCGAVAAVAENIPVGGNIPALVAPIIPAVEKMRHAHPDASASELVDLAIEANVWNSIESLLVRSQIVRERLSAGVLAVQGAIYDIRNGKVRWLGIHPRQADFLRPATVASCNGTA
ncbi:MAG: carbonic anhydrase [Opitutales bacterium]